MKDGLEKRVEMMLVMLKCLHVSHSTVGASERTDSTAEKPHECEIYWP